MWIRGSQPLDDALRALKQAKAPLQPCSFLRFWSDVNNDMLQINSRYSTLLRRLHKHATAGSRLKTLNFFDFKFHFSALALNLVYIFAAYSSGSWHCQQWVKSLFNLFLTLCCLFYWESWNDRKFGATCIRILVDKTSKKVQKTIFNVHKVLIINNIFVYVEIIVLISWEI